MFTPTRNRRDRDRDQRRAAANRRIGHDMAYWYYWGPKIAVVAVMLAVYAGARWVWTNVEPGQIAAALGCAGLLVLLTYLAWNLSTFSAYSRSMLAAKGKTRSVTMHLVGAAGALLVAAAFFMWQAAA